MIESTSGSSSPVTFSSADDTPSVRSLDPEWPPITAEDQRTLAFGDQRYNLGFREGKAAGVRKGIQIGRQIGIQTGMLRERRKIFKRENGFQVKEKGKPIEKRRLTV